MAIRIVVPELGESVIEATVSHWRKKPGDSVAAGEAVVELETEKVNLEVGAERAGVLARIERAEGEDVRIGDVLGVIEEHQPAEGGAAPANGGAPAQAAERGQPSTPTEEARDGGRDREPAEAAQVAQPAPPAAPATEAIRAEPITPVARRMAEARGIDPAQVPPAAGSRRVTKEAVEAYLAQQTAPATSTPAPSAGAAARQQTPAAPGTEGAARREERVRLSRRRRTIARRLVEAQQTAAMLTTFNEIDMGAVMEIRRRRKESFKERHGIGLGFMSFFVKASIGALKAFPRLNAELQEDDLVLKHYYDIGMAIGAEDGLVVPVVRDADRLSFAEIERAIDGYVKQAREGTLGLEDLRGGTFTITNGGVFGSLLSTPILNPPQVGILGLHKIEERPIARQGEVVIRPMMYVALSYDHRIVDGREAVQFLVRVKELIEDSETLLLEG
jgi:2-oxoglutarate dehydrogenase E2 component (dihydrolipoamide succinyltransferase)